MTRPKPYYPIFADLAGRRCVVVGGGLIAERKVSTLVSYGALVTVVSPSLTRRLAASARQGRIRHVARRFRTADLRGAWLAYAATDDQAVNEAVSKAGAARRIFTNVVDQPALCSFIAPAILRRDLLTIAVSTGGASPSVAKKVRDELRRSVAPSYAPMLRLLTGLRTIAKQKLPSYQDRKRYFGQLVDGQVFALVRAGKPAAARQAALGLLERHAAEQN